MSWVLCNRDERQVETELPEPMYDGGMMLITVLYSFGFLILSLLKPHWP